MRILICGERNWTDRKKIAQQLRIIKAAIVETQIYWSIELENAGVDIERLGLGIVIQGCNGYDSNGYYSWRTKKPTVRGADMIAREEAIKLGFNVKDYPVEAEDWAHFKGGAGHIRNQLMLDEGKPDLVLAFHSNLVESKGTKDMVNRAMMAQIPVEVIS